MEELERRAADLEERWERFLGWSYGEAHGRYRDL
jgi:hypothetical protein